MYIPSSFSQVELPVLHQFIERFPFATLVSNRNSEPFASHLPLLLDPDAGPAGRLVGHMARGNLQWDMTEEQTLLAIFHGPHTYISPTWYASENVVPTWNYVVVHAYGRPTWIHDKPKLLSIVSRMVDTFEKGLPSPWSTASQNPEFIDKLLGAIVGFEIQIERLEGKWKLNQNQPVERRQRVIEALNASGHPEQVEIANLMSLL